VRRATRPDLHYAWLNLTTALAADAVWWNSAHNQATFAARTADLLAAMPDYRPRFALDLVTAKSRVMPLGLDLSSLAEPTVAAGGGSSQWGPAERPRLIWNHRWEHDKGPAAFVETVDALIGRGVDFEVAILGESFGSVPDAFIGLAERWGPRLVHMGYVSRSAYAAWLRSGTAVLSTANHEFFGAAVCEAVACGCLPVLPAGLAYDEVMPAGLHGEILYSDPWQRIELLERHLTQPSATLRSTLMEHVQRYDWGRIAPLYDDALAAVRRDASAHFG
jgi:glycosyltransferase involved in cell wall biosynthesis